MNTLDKHNDEPSAFDFQSKVAKVFMLDDGFFSPIMRNKIPDMLFKNGSSGLDRMFPLSRPSSAQPFRGFPFDERSESPLVVRHVPIKVQPNKNNFQRFDNSTSSSESDSSGTLRYDSRRPSNLYSDRGSTLAPSLSRRSTPSPQPPQRIQVSRSATPTDPFDYSSSTHKLPSYYPQKLKTTNNSNNSSFDSLPPRNDRLYERQPYTSKARPYQSTSTLKLSTPSLNESNNSPTVSFLRRTQTQNDVLDDDNQKGHKNKETPRFSPPLSRRESEPVIVLEEDSNESTLPPRPNSRLSAKSRAKSPSMNSLRQGLKKANFIAQCLTKQNKPDRKDLEVNVDNDDSAYKPSSIENGSKPQKEQASPNKSGRSSFLSFWTKPSRTQSTPSLADPKPLSLRRPSENDLTLDPVEEAIKSLENFDPNEYIKPTNQSNDSNKPFANSRSQSIEKLAPPLRSYGSVNLPYTTSLPPIPKVDYNLDSNTPKMGNQNSGTNSRQKPPTPVNPQREPQQVTFQTPPTNSHTEADTRRRVLRQQMTDNAKSIELHAIKLGRIVSNSNWRQSKQLEQTLPHVRDIVYGVDNSLYDLIDAAARVSLQRNDPAYQELQLLLNPLRTSHSLIRRLRTTLNLTNWSVALLSRQGSKGSENTNDSLDQFVAILKHLPNDCSKLVHWIYNQDRINMMTFLPAGVSTAAPPPSVNQQEHPYQSRQQLGLNRVEMPRTPVEMPRTPLEPPKNRPHNLSPMYSAVRRDKPLTNTKNTPRWHGETVDGGESTTSSNDSSPNTRSMDEDDHTAKYSSSTASNQRNRDSIIDDDNMIMEEDDLASVISEQPSPTWQHAPEFPTTKLRQNSGEKQRRNLHMEMVKNLSEEEYEFIKFCGPQINQHVDTLTQVIEQFFNTIETGQHPSKFAQKLRLITMSTNTLIHLSSNVAKNMSQPVLRAEFKHAADTLDSLVLECEHKLEVAKKQHPSVSAIQALVSAVVNLSKQAQNLKLITRTCQLATNDSR